MKVTGAPSGYRIVSHGASRSFPDGDSFLEGSDPSGEIVVHIGVPRDALVPRPEGCICSLVEVGTECLGAHADEHAAIEGDDRVGFARWRLGDGRPSNLIELVVQPATLSGAQEAALSLFDSAGFTVVVCRDVPGRILDRLVRPYFNDALRALDAGIATAADLDKTVRSGLGYPEGPISLLERTGLAAHHDVSRAVYLQLGEQSFLPARRAITAAQRRDSSPLKDGSSELPEGNGSVAK